MANDTGAKWSIEGEYFESCNCELLCPCLLSHAQIRPTEGHCDVVLATHIASGKCGDVDLTGLNAVQALTTPGPMAQGNGTLAVYVDSRASEPQRALLERLCPLLEGKPILECGDHAVIELEYDLRDHTQPPPVAGIVLPANSDPLFALSVRLVRGVMADYRRQTSYTGNVNFYVKPSSARWLALSQRDRQEEIAAGLRSFPGGQNFHLIRLEGDRRVILEMGDTADGGRNLLKLEHHLRRSVEPVLQLHLETKADLNTIRRIKEVKA